MLDVILLSLILLIFQEKIIFRESQKVRRRIKNRKDTSVFLHRKLSWDGYRGENKKKKPLSLWLASVAAVVVSGCFPPVYVRAARILGHVFLLCAAQHVGLDFIAVT